MLNDPNNPATTSIAKVLAVIDTIALLRIRDIEAKKIADHRESRGITTEDKSAAANAIFDILRRESPDADRNKLQLRIEEGNRWITLIGKGELGIVAMAYSLPPAM
jgi:hypothetical protein